MEPEECAARWKSLRDKFVREGASPGGGYGILPVATSC